MFSKFFILLIALFLLTTPILAGSCNFAFKEEWQDSWTESFYHAECEICLVEIKAATNLFQFVEDGCVAGYCVSGIGTHEGHVYEADPRHDISHVKWYIDCDPTAVSLKNISAESGTPVILLLVAILVLLVRKFR